MASLNDLRGVIAETLAIEKSYNLPAKCVSYGLPDGSDDEAHMSKRNYVRNRLIDKDKAFLVALAQKVLEEYESERLYELLPHFTSSGVAGQAKNLIFASNGPKPEIIIADAVNNDIQIVKNAESCLVFDEPFPTEGLQWQALVAWWAKKEQQEVSSELRHSLYSRLRESLDSYPEKLLFDAYYRKGHSMFGARLPALVPQVYLHYDPKTIRQLGGEKRLTHQRMDFLMLLPLNVRIVLEIDGKQHYSDNDTSNPSKYAQMVAADRDLRLSGYEVYRFGGSEFCGKKEEVANRIWSFFIALFQKHKLTS